LKIKNKIAVYKKRLFNISENEPLSKMSLIVIFALDVFVVSMIFAGLSDHTSLLTSPYEYMPPVCRGAIIESDWSGDGKIDRLQTLVLSSADAYRYRARGILDSSEIDKTHPACRRLLSGIRRIKEDEALVALFRKRQITQKNRQQLAKRFKDSKEVYDTRLLEDIAAGTESGNLPAISENAKKQSEALNELDQRLSEYEKTISENPSVVAFSKTIEDLASRRETTLSDIRQFDFWYPIKELAWQFVFLIPLFALFYVWNGRSIQKNRHLQILISSHLLVVAFIPILFKILELLLEIIPHRLLESLFDLLISLKIIAIWHYIVILLAVLLTFFAVYLIQKKIFSKERIMQKRLMKGACYECGKKLPHQTSTCPFCGKKQHLQCAVCEKDTYRAGKFCVHCGALNSTGV